MSIPGSATPLLLATTAAAAADFQIDRSLRFNSADSAYLNRTPSSAGSGTTWTLSGWVKRAGFFGTYTPILMSADTSSTTEVAFDTSNRLQFVDGSTKYRVTDAVFRDPSAWYHIVVTWDTTNSTVASRCRIYVNGTEQSYSTEATISENATTDINTTDIHYIGRQSNTYTNCYQAEIHFIDGQALAPTDFGETDSDNNWNPKAYSGSYGTNGFHLDFSDNSSNAALGDDSSGNNNDWTVNNLAAEAPGLSTANEGFEVVTYTGNGGTQSITGLGFQPDFCWFKNTSGQESHNLVNSVCGVNKRLFSDATNAENSTVVVNSFDSDGFTVTAANGSSGTNPNGGNMVAWCWKAGGSAVSNTDGSITSSVSANNTYGFSIVTWTGTGSAATIGHGLNAVSQFILLKFRGSTSNWSVYHSAIGNTKRLVLNSTGSTSTSSTYWNNTSPTSSVFSVGGDVNDSTTIVAYCWSEVSGFSKFGSYSGNGSTQKLTFGFKPAYVIIKRSDSSTGGDWYVFDYKRVSGTGEDLLRANTTAADDPAYDYFSFDADGITLTTGTTLNGSGRSYVYAAFAQKPDESVIDSLIDTPTNYEADSGNNGGNYATLNPLQNIASDTFSDGNLEVATSNSNYGTHTSTIAIPPSSGKFYVEVVQSNVVDAQPWGMVGICAADSTFTTQSAIRYLSGVSYYSYNGKKFVNTAETSYGASWGNGDVIGIAYDSDNLQITFYKNGASQGTITGVTSDTYYLGGSYWDSTKTGTYTWNFGQRPFAYTPPTGFKSLCTQNLPDPTIADGSTAFDAKLYTGDGANSRTISGYSFSPDFLWVKDRANSGGDYSHRLIDAVRGAGVSLSSNQTAIERDHSAQAGGGVETFTSDGFTIEQGTSNNNNQNNNNTPYIAWAWDGGTSTVSNTDGSITSSVRANLSAGFSICKITTPTSDGQFTFGHGLNAAPELVIYRRINTTMHWYVYHSGYGAANKYTLLNATNAVNSGTYVFNNTYPSASVITDYASDSLHHNEGEDMIYYCFAPVAGYSAFGSYTGNGSSDGPFVFTGFKVALLAIKRTDSTGAWKVLDTSRSPFNVASEGLDWNTSGSEFDSSENNVDILSNGFKLKTSHGARNASGGTFIYMAWASHPFKTARAR